MQVQKSPHITRAGRSRLEAELRELEVRRAATTAALAAAAAEGDRSENAEYIYRKKELREIDRRLGYLLRRLPALQVVDAVRSGHQVYFGAWVTLEDDTGAVQRFRIVGADEFDHAPGYISVDAPLARALLGRTTGDEIRIDVAGNVASYVIAGLDYPDSG